VQFTVEALHRDQMALVKKLQASTGIVKVESIKDTDPGE
jgi:hypothetical protein